MSWKLSDLRGDDVLARDGAVGRLDDVYFDAQRWSVRYMVVDTDGQVAGRKMLVSPQAVEAGLSDPGKLRLAATREQLGDGAQAEAHLRSIVEVLGCDVQAIDGVLGRVDDFVIDERTWKISGVVVDTLKWWPGGEIRVSPEHVERIDWAARKLHVRLSRDELKAARG